MTTTRCSTVPVGVFSEGTLREQDLGDAIADLLEPLRLSRYDRALVREWMRARHREDTDHCIDLAWEMTEALDRYLPPYTWAGAHEGDGACFGVWPITEQDIYVGSDVLLLGPDDDFPPNYKGEFHQVNDHGNVTVGYRRRNGAVTEYWSVV